MCLNIEQSVMTPRFVRLQSSRCCILPHLAVCNKINRNGSTSSRCDMSCIYVSFYTQCMFV